MKCVGGSLSCAGFLLFSSGPLPCAPRCPCLPGLGSGTVPAAPRGRCRRSPHPYLPFPAPAPGASRCRGARSLTGRAGSSGGLRVGGVGLSRDTSSGAPRRSPSCSLLGIRVPWVGRASYPILPLPVPPRRCGAASSSLPLQREFRPSPVQCRWGKRSAQPAAALRDQGPGAGAAAPLGAAFPSSGQVPPEDAAAPSRPEKSAVASGSAGLGRRQRGAAGGSSAVERLRQPPAPSTAPVLAGSGWGHLCSALHPGVLKTCRNRDYFWLQQGRCPQVKPGVCGGSEIKSWFAIIQALDLAAGPTLLLRVCVK